METKNEIKVDILAPDFDAESDFLINFNLNEYLNLYFSKSEAFTINWHLLV